MRVCMYVYVCMYVFLLTSIAIIMSVSSSSVCMYVCMYFCCGCRSREKERAPKAETIRTVLASIVARYITQYVCASDVISFHCMY